MQNLQGVTISQLKAKIRRPKAKFEIYYGGAWVDLTNLGGQNYLKDWTLSLGGARMTPDPVAGTWTAVIANPDGIFYPANPNGAYKDYFTTGRLVRISIGGRYGGVDVYWQRMRGVMSSPKFSAKIGGDVQLAGMDYFQYLADYIFSSPNNYWGSNITKSTIDPFELSGSELYAEGDACEIGAGEAPNVASWSVPGEITLSSIADTDGGSVYVMRAQLGAGYSYTTDIFATAGAQIWTCPAGVFFVNVRVRGAGAGGGGSSSLWAAGGGGGGGAESEKLNIPVIPGHAYAVFVGAPGIGGFGTASGSDGGYSYFIDLTTLLAEGGKGGTAGTGIGNPGVGGLRGLAVNGVGDTKYDGGDGGDGEDGDGGGGGGGSSAGTDAGGGNGSDGSPGPGGGGTRGIAPAGGSDGGDGGDGHDDGHTPAGGNGGAGGGAGSVSFANLWGADGKPGKVSISYTIVGSFAVSITNSDIGSVVQGATYRLIFNYKVVSGPASMVAGLYIGTERQGEITGLASTSWATKGFYFKASVSGPAIMKFDLTVPTGTAEIRIDQISLMPGAVSPAKLRYSMPAECTGVYYMTWDGNPIWYGVDSSGWFYDALHNEIYFSLDTPLIAGTNNLIVYYHTLQIPLYVIAGILVRAKLYATRAAALAAMIYTESGPSIPRVWFEAGTTGLSAIKMLCEFCNFRFYFDYGATPVFIPPPEIKGAGLEDAGLEQNHILDPEYYENADEYFNIVSIEGEKISQPIGLDQTMPSNYKGSDNDGTTGVRTKSISNYLFQSDAACAAMATEILAVCKDIKKGFNFTAKLNAIPLEFGDTIRAQVRLAPPSGAGAKWGKFKWSDGTKWGVNGIVIVHRGKIRDIKLNKYDATYICELAE